MPVRAREETAQNASGRASNNSRKARTRGRSQDQTGDCTEKCPDEINSPGSSATGLPQQQRARPQGNQHRQPGRQQRGKNALHPEGTEAEAEGVVAQDQQDADAEALAATGSRTWPRAETLPIKPKTTQAIGKVNFSWMRTRSLRAALRLPASASMRSPRSPRRWSVVGIVRQASHLERPGTQGIEVPIEIDAGGAAVEVEREDLTVSKFPFASLSFQSCPATSIWRNPALEKSSTVTSTISPLSKRRE